MYRTHNCGQLRIKDENTEVKLCGWIQKTRNLGGLTFIDLRDRYGLTQLFFDSETNKDLCQKAIECNREYVIQVEGKVRERSNKNNNIPTGDVEVVVNKLNLLSKSASPPFTIEDETDGGEELRMKYRYLDLRRSSVRQGIIFRHKVAQEVRHYLSTHNFLEIETPTLIKSTPEGARDFIVPSRMNKNQFYALPQSPQVFKQLLMLSGFDRYFQIVKCYRDEDLRADRQPEFTQIDCELAFVSQQDILTIFENLVKYLLKTLKNITIENDFPILPYAEAVEKYGSDKPDLRFGMLINDITTEAQNKNFVVFNNAEYVGGICAKGCATYTRKQLDGLTGFVKKPQVGAKGLIYVKWNENDTYKSSVDKFFDPNDLKNWAEKMQAKKGDLLLIMAGKKKETLTALGKLRLEMGDQLGVKDTNTFSPLWVIDFPLLEWNEDTQRYHAMHHPFTSPKNEDIHLIDSKPDKVRGDAYDLVINGIEIGGGSIRIHSSELQSKIFKVLGFTQEEATQQFGFLINAFKYGAPPHGGIAFGFDRLVALLFGTNSIRDIIAFPKNNAGRDVMMDAPSEIDSKQLKELNIQQT